MTDENHGPASSPDPEPASITNPSPSKHAVDSPQAASSAEALADGLRRLWACNPLYLVSAALLLYSFYLVSSDRNFLNTEISQLWFNLGSLQLYEAVVVATAIFLARRAVWYDSTLLAGLENMLVLVPFILISQAALNNIHLVWFLCCGAGLLAATRLGLLKRYVARLNLPPRMLAIGAVLLVVNVALPVAYRILHESKFGTKPDWGAAYQTNQYVWWLLVPTVCALANMVPWQRSGGELWPERRWLPAGFFTLWLAGTGVHVYCLDYVYDFDLRPDLVAPMIWALAWTLSFRLMGSFPAKAGWRSVLWVVPAVATLLATAQPGKQVFLVLTTLNLAAYTALYLRQRARLALHLSLISLLALLAALPEGWGRSLVIGYSRENFILGVGAVYLLGCIAVSRDAKLGVLGSVWAGIVTGVLAPESNAFHWGFEVGLAFLLLHSLRWTESPAEGTALVRWAAAGVWVGHAILWSHVFGGGWRACAVAIPVLVVWFAFRWLQGYWGPRAVVVASLLVLFAAPGHLAAVQVQSTPAGVLGVIGSFVLFGMGTLAAIARNGWRRS